MGDRTGSALLLPLIAILAVVLPGAMTSARQPAAAAGVSTARETLTAQGQLASQPRTADALIHEYYELTSVPAPPSKDDATSVQLRVEGSGPEGAVRMNLAARKEIPTAPVAAAPVGHKAVRCLIATLPDPIDAGNISYMFDRYLDATQRAMEVGGFVLDRFDVPWLDKEPGERYRREPARLLFHGEPSREHVPEVALLFLVGETPTAGIHKIAFATAIDEMARSCLARDYVPVVGPSFSGSQASLRALLEHYQGLKTFDIVSGSATAIDTDNLVPPGVAATFRRTITPDAILRNQLYEIVRASERRPATVVRALALLRRPGPTRVAVLFEGNTSFGASFGQKLAQPANQPSVAGIDVTEIPFPLHISRLRAAARQEHHADTEPLDLVGRRQALTRLELHESVTQRTVVPLQSRLETSSMEIVLSSLLRTLDEQDVRYVSVVATDVQDLIFLSQQIRHHLPNTLLFLFSNDLLYLHPDANTDLRGAQIISPYPLFPPNLQWTSGSSRQLLFPSHTTQGVYNATLTALGYPTHLQEYGHPRRRASVPPLWLSIVGADQIWPVRFFETASPPASMAPAPGRRSGKTWRLWTPGHPWLALFAIALGWLPTLYLMSNAGARWGPRRICARFSTGPLAELFSESIFPTQRLQRRIYLLRCWSAVATPYVLCTFMLLLPWTVWRVRPAIEWTRSSGTLIVEVVLALGLILVAVGLVALTRLACTDPANGLVDVRGPRPVPITSRQPDRRLWPAVVWVLVPLVFAAATALVWLLDRNETAEDAIFLYLRGTDLASGVSPLLPLLFFSGSALTWAATSLRRLRLLEGPSQYPVQLRRNPRRLARSFLGFAGGSFKGIRPLEQRLVEAIGQSSRSLMPTALISIVVIMLVAALGLFVRRGVPSIEGAAFDLLFMFSFFVVNMAAALAMVRLMLIWYRLSRLLRRLAWHPTIKAYDRLANKIPGKPKINLTGQSQIFTALEFSVDRAAELVTKARELAARVPKAPERHPLAPLVDLLRPSAPAPPPSPQFTDAVRTHLVPLTDEVRRAQQALDRALKAAAERRWADKVAARTRAEQHLSCIAGDVTKMLKEAWRQPASYWVRTATEKPDEAAIMLAAEDFLASRVAGLLSHVVPQLQNLVVCVISVLLLLLIGVTSYPLQPHQLLLRFATIEIVTAVTVVLFLFVQMERDTILSALSESTPGQISWSRDFISRVAIYVLLPLLGVLGAQFPEVFQQVFSWTRTAFTTH